MSPEVDMLLDEAKVIARVKIREPRAVVLERTTRGEYRLLLESPNERLCIRIGSLQSHGIMSELEARQEWRYTVNRRSEAQRSRWNVRTGDARKHRRRR